MRLLASRGFSPRLLATFSNGHATEAAQGVRLNYDLCIDPSVYPVVAATIGNMHRQMNDQVFTNLRNLLNRKYTNNAKAGRLSVACANASHKAVTTVRYTCNYHDSFDLRSLFTVAFKFFIDLDLFPHSCIQPVSTLLAVLYSTLSGRGCQRSPLDLRARRPRSK